MGPGAGRPAATRVPGRPLNLNHSTVTVTRDPEAAGSPAAAGRSGYPARRRPAPPGPARAGGIRVQGRYGAGPQGPPAWAGVRRLGGDRTCRGQPECSRVGPARPAHWHTGAGLRRPGPWHCESLTVESSS